MTTMNTCRVAASYSKGMVIGLILAALSGCGGSDGEAFRFRSGDYLGSATFSLESKLSAPQCLNLGSVLSLNGAYLRVQNIPLQLESAQLRVSELVYTSHGVLQTTLVEGEASAHSLRWSEERSDWTTSSAEGDTVCMLGANETTLVPINEDTIEIEAHFRFRCVSDNAQFDCALGEQGVLTLESRNQDAKL